MAKRSIRPNLNEPEHEAKICKVSGSAKYKSKFKSEWEKLYPVRAVKNDRYAFSCVPCNKVVRCDHQGLKDVKDHCTTETHKQRVQTTNSQPPISHFLNSAAQSMNVSRAEVMVTNFLIQHNLPIATAEHLAPLFKKIFPDSNIAKSYACSRTKTSAIINKAMGPHCHEYLVEHCKKHPFSLGIDGSSDTDVAKMNPVTLRIFDVNRSKTVTSHFYDMCITSGEHAGKAEEIFRVFNAKMVADDMPWAHAVSLSIDNTNSMIGQHNSFASRSKVKNPDIYVNGCPCHLVHIAASNAHDESAKRTKISMEELQVDLFYWFDKSTKRKGVLVDYMAFCDQEYAKILKHVSTRWLSLERCIQRTLEKYAGLKSYFLSEDFADSRFKRLHEAFKNPLTEITLLFHQASIPIFNRFNKLMQSDEPVIHILLDSINRLAKTLATRIIKPEVIRDTPILQLDLSNTDIYKPKNSIHLGGLTKMKLSKLLNDGDISKEKHDAFFDAAQAYFRTALSYIIKKFPLSNDVIFNASWIDVSNRIDAKWDSVEFFFRKFEAVLNGVSIDDLFDEFSDYQTMTDEAIGKDAFKEAKVVDGEEDDKEVFHYRIDILWWHLSNMLLQGTSSRRFPNLSKVAEVVLVLPHSNAGEERLFSIVRKNKTEARASLKLDGTLSNLLAMKCQYPEATVPCFKWKPEKKLIESSKKAAAAYNAEHVNKQK